MGKVAEFIGAQRRRRVASEANLEVEELEALHAGVHKFAKTIAKIPTKEDVEPGISFFPVGERRMIVKRMKPIFRKLNRARKLQELSVKDIVRLMKGIMHPVEEGEIESALGIEEKLEQKTFKLTQFLTRILWHFDETGDRRYIYNFFRVAMTKLEEEIELAKKEAGIAAREGIKKKRTAA